MKICQLRSSCGGRSGKCQKDRAVTHRACLQLELLFGLLTLPVVRNSLLSGNSLLSVKEIGVYLVCQMFFSKSRLPPLLYPSGLCVSLCVMLRWPWSLWPNSIFPTQKAGFPGGSGGQESTCNAGGLGSIPGLGRSLEKEMATHSSIIAWESPWTEEPGGLQSTGHKESYTPEWLNTAQKD